MRRVLLTQALCLGASACVAFDRQSALDPAGPQSASIYRLGVGMVVVAALVYVVVVAVLLAIVRRRTPPEDVRSPAREARARRTIVISVGATVAILFVLLVFDLGVARALMHDDARPAVAITLTGRQWWWDVEYEDSIPQNRVRDANEIHVPVGQPVRIKLVSHDVIHSFWVPNIAGKKDLIPGHEDEIRLRVDRAGVYRGQCAEFCGIEHAKMALLVVAQPPGEFAAWLAHQRAAAAPPSDSLAARGRFVFESAPCATCHTVAGTAAAGRVGPDLSHIGSRRTLAAGTRANTRGNLAGWIVDPQTLKPGAQMPAHPLAPADLRALVAYLESLR
ncbi:MAG: cytochrome c oxidase subunit II [Gemmatimonadaceae bacterium]